MNVIWIYLFIAIGGLIFGALFTAIAYTIWDWFRRKVFYSRYPKTNDIIGLANPGNEEITKKEAVEHEQKARREFRQYENLRRLGTNEFANRKIGTADRSIQGDGEYEQRQSIPIEPDKRDTRVEDNDGEERKSSKRTRPTDF